MLTAWWLDCITQTIYHTTYDVYPYVMHIVSSSITNKPRTVPVILYGLLYQGWWPPANLEISTHGLSGASSIATARLSSSIHPAEMMRFVPGVKHECTSSVRHSVCYPRTISWPCCLNDFVPRNDLLFLPFLIFLCQVQSCAYSAWAPVSHYRFLFFLIGHQTFAPLNVRSVWLISYTLLAAQYPAMSNIWFLSMITCTVHQARGNVLFLRGQRLFVARCIRKNVRP